MMADAKLDKRFWSEAVSTAVYLKNRSPNKGLKNQTPYEVWYGVKPVLSHLKVFACIALSHIPKVKHLQWDPKSEKCIFLGYS